MPVPASRLPGYFDATELFWSPGCISLLPGSVVLLLVCKGVFTQCQGVHLLQLARRVMAVRKAHKCEHNHNNAENVAIFDSTKYLMTKQFSLVR